MTAIKEPPKKTRLTRLQAAERIAERLGDEPISAAELRRQILGGDGRDGGQSDVIRSGLAVLEAQRRAKRIPRLGWTRMESPHDAAIKAPETIKFPYSAQDIRTDQMFVDRDYQRPLTSLAKKIKGNFNVFQCQPLSLSDRGTKSKPRYAIMDGQTRWWAATELGIVSMPCAVYKDLTPEDEARLFSQFQTQRKGMVSWHRFRADLRAGEPMQVDIKRICDTIGYVLGDGVGQLKSVAALEACYRQDPYTLERTLSDLKDAWPDEVPEAPHIRGLQYFFRHYPIGQRKHEDPNDEVLVRRLKAAGPESLKRKMSALKETGERGSTAKMMGTIIQRSYQGGGRS